MDDGLRSAVTQSPTPTATPTTVPPTPVPLNAQYFYDGDGNMVKSVVNNVTTYYPGRHYNKEVNGAAEKTQKFYQAAGQTIAVRTNNSPDLGPNYGELKWTLSDHLGSTSVTANADGTWNSELRYTPYGEIRYNSGITPTDYRYTGQLQQAELGLYYYVARWYDPSIMMFNQPDSFIPDQSNPIDWNRYAYARGNPLQYKDSSGHFPDSWDFSFTIIDTFQIQQSLDQFGEKVGVENLSGQTAEFLSGAALTLDVAAGALDAVACITSTAGIVVGATSGAVITLPGGGTTVVGGWLGASVGLATAEIGNQVFLQPANILATVATTFSVSAEVITGRTGVRNTLTINSEGLIMEGNAIYGPGAQTGPYLTALGWYTPLSYISAGLQYSAIRADLGLLSPAPLYADARFGINLKEKDIDFRLNFRHNQEKE